MTVLFSFQAFKEHRNTVSKYMNRLMSWYYGADKKLLLRYQ